MDRYSQTKKKLEEDRNEVSLSEGTVDPQGERDHNKMIASYAIFSKFKL